MLKVRHRARMRTKDVERVDERLATLFGVPFLEGANAVDRAEAGDTTIIIRDGVVWAFEREDAYLPTVRALLAARPTRRFVTVDMGAIRFVNNGADIMSPGITEADDVIEPGDPVWVRDEKNHQPLAVGEALVPGGEMAPATKGKAVKNIHRVGDEWWELSF